MTHIIREYGLDVPFGTFEIFVGIFQRCSVFSHPVSLLFEKGNYNFFDYFNSEFYHV